MLGELRGKGWTLAALADELGVYWTAIYKWQAGETYPRNAKPVLLALRGLTKRRRVPKRHRPKG